jgi:hypothetical protein
LKILILCSGSVDLKILLTVDSCEMKTKIGETEDISSFLSINVFCYVYQRNRQFEAKATPYKLIHMQLFNVQWYIRNVLL